MKAAPEQQRKLLELQAFDTELIRLARREAQLPERAKLDQIASEHAATRDEFMARQRALEDTQLEMQRLDADVALVMERLHRDESKLDSSTSGKEASALTHELESLKAREQQLEEVQFVVMERHEAEQQAFAEAEAKLQELHDARLNVQAALDEATAQIAEERSKIGVSREVIASSLPTDLLELYEETRERYGIGAALLRGKISEGSNMALTDADLVEIRETNPNEVVFCQASGCILVRTEESAL